MKNNLIIISGVLSIILFSILPDIQGLIMGHPLEFWDSADIILDGTVISSSQNDTKGLVQHDVKVNQYFKNPKSQTMITVYGPGIYNEDWFYPKFFNEGERALFYLKKIDDKYIILPQSIAANERCDPRDMIGLSTLPGEPIGRGGPTLFFDPYQTCNGYLYPVEFLSKTLSPLKQFEAGIKLDDIWCKENFVLVIKSTNGKPACIRPETVPKIIERGWGLPAYSPGEIPMGFEISKPKDLTMEVISSDWCSSLTLDKIPPNGLTKRMDWFGANALIMTIGEEELSQVPHLTEMINEMKNSTGFKPHEFDENVMVKQISGSGIDHSKIFNWLRENFEKQYAPRGDGSFSSFFQYNRDTYSIRFAQC